MKELEKEIAELRAISTLDHINRDKSIIAQKALKIIESLQAENKKMKHFIKTWMEGNAKIKELVEGNIVAEKTIDFMKKERSNLEKLYLKTKEEFNILMDSHNHFINKPIYKHCDKLEAENKTLSEALDSSTQTNKAMGERLEELQSKLEEAKEEIKKFLGPKEFYESGFINFHCVLCGHQPKKFDDAAKEALRKINGESNDR